MKLVGKVPVEPLDDDRLTNIERNLVVRVSELRQARGLGRFAAAVTSPRGWLVLAAVAMLVLVAGVAGYKLSGNGAPGVGGKLERLAMSAGALDLGDAQITGDDFTVTRTPSRVEIVMQPGKLDLHVEHEPERLFVVKAGDVEIEDVGTRFTVAYDGKNVDVRVTEGEVKVKHAGKDVAVTASNAWTRELGPIAIVELEARMQLAGLDGATAAPRDADPPTRDDAEHFDQGTRGARDDATTPAADVTPSAGTSTGSTRTPSGGSVSSSAAPPSTSTTKKSGPSNARKALEAVPVTPPVDVGVADPVAAVNEYSKRIAALSGDTSRMLYSMALVQHRSGNDIAALRTLVGVTRREGGDAYRDGMWLEVRIKCLRTFDDECRRAAERFRQKFDSGQATGALDAVLGEIYQQR